MIIGPPRVRIYHVPAVLTFYCFPYMLAKSLVDHMYLRLILVFLFLEYNHLRKLNC